MSKKQCSEGQGPAGDGGNAPADQGDGRQGQPQDGPERVLGGIALVFRRDGSASRQPANDGQERAPRPPPALPQRAHPVPRAEFQSDQAVDYDVDQNPDPAPTNPLAHATIAVTERVLGVTRRREMPLRITPIYSASRQAANDGQERAPPPALPQRAHPVPHAEFPSEQAVDYDDVDQNPDPAPANPLAHATIAVTERVLGVTRRREIPVRITPIYSASRQPANDGQERAPRPPSPQRAHPVPRAEFQSDQAVDYDSTDTEDNGMVENSKSETGSSSSGRGPSQKSGASRQPSSNNAAPANPLAQVTGAIALVMSPANSLGRPAVATDEPAHEDNAQPPAGNAGPPILIGHCWPRDSLL